MELRTLQRLGGDPAPAALRRRGRRVQFRRLRQAVRGDLQPGRVAAFQSLAGRRDGRHQVQQRQFRRQRAAPRQHVAGDPRQGLAGEHGPDRGDLHQVARRHAGLPPQHRRHRPGLPAAVGHLQQGQATTTRSRASCIMRRGENPSEVLERVQEAVAELNATTLPKGVRLDTFYDRTFLVETTLHTVGAQRAAGDHPGGAGAVVVPRPAVDGGAGGADDPLRAVGGAGC